MKIFLLDLWNDLRAKRLWPLAVVLVLALVAAPVLLSKEAEAPDAASVSPPAAAPTAPEDEGPAALAEVKLEELAEGSGSSLSAFDDPSNPFAPPRKVLEAAKAEDQAAPGGPGADAGAAAAVGGGSTGGGSAGGGLDLGLGDDGGTGGGTGGGTVDPGGDTGDRGGDKRETTRSFTYVVDLTFRENNRRRRIKGLEKLDILPRPESPLLIFLGVGKNAGNAVFLVDSTLQAAGEGSCRPSGSDCAFLYIGPGSQHEFTGEDGSSYSIRIDEIRRVELDGKGRAAKASDRPRAGAALGKPAASRRFMPLLADLVTVSSGAANKSNDDTESR